MIAAHYVKFKHSHKQLPEHSTAHGWQQTHHVHMKHQGRLKIALKTMLWCQSTQILPPVGALHILNWLLKVVFPALFTAWFKKGREVWLCKSMFLIFKLFYVKFPKLFWSSHWTVCLYNVTVDDGVFETHGWHRVCWVQQCDVSMCLKKFYPVLISHMKCSFVVMSLQFPVREGDRW